MGQDGGVLGVAQQLAEAADLPVPNAGDHTALLELIQRVIAKVSPGATGSGCQLGVSQRVTCCKVLQQLLEMSLENPISLQQPTEHHIVPSTQVLFQEVLRQLPGAGQHRVGKQPMQHSAQEHCSGLVQWIQDQQPGAGLYLPQLLGAAAGWMQVALDTTAASAAGKWCQSQEWLLGQQLLQLAVAIAQQAARRQLKGLCNSRDAQAALESSCEQLLLALAAAVSAAGALATAESSMAVLAALPSVELMHQLLQQFYQLGVLTREFVQHSWQRLLQLVLPTSLCAAQASEGPQQIAGHSPDALSDLLTPQAVLQPAAAAALAQSGLQAWHPQRLQTLALLLSTNSTCCSWSELAALFPGEGGNAGSDGWSGLLLLVVLVLQAVAAAQSAADQAVKAANDKAAQQAAKERAAGDADSEPDYFQEIFGSDGGPDDDAGPAVVAESTLTPEQALSHLAVVLLRGLAAHLTSLAATSSSHSPANSSSWAPHNQHVLQLALCCLGFSFPCQAQQHQELQQQHQHGDLAAAQQSVEAAVLEVCLGCPAAMQQVQSSVLLAPVSPLAAGHKRPHAVLAAAAQATLQHAAVAASTKPASAASFSAAAVAAASADPPAALLRAPWLHLATQLACITEEAVSSTSLQGSTPSQLQQLQDHLTWLLAPDRLAVVLATALAAPAPERVLLAAVMLHCLARCCAAAAASKQHTSAADEAGSSPDGSTGVVGSGALAVCAMHAYLSTLLWLLLPPKLLPTAWLQRHLQSALQPLQANPAHAAAESADDSVGVVTLRQEPWPAGLAWVAALLQYKHVTDELPLLLESLNNARVDEPAQESLAGLLPGLIPSCLPGLAVPENVSAMQQGITLMQQENVLEVARSLLLQWQEQQQQQQTGGGDDAGQLVPQDAAGWGQLDSWAQQQGSHCSCATLVVEQALDSALPSAAGVWAAKGGGGGVAMAVAYSCCQERALQLLLVLQQQQQTQAVPVPSSVGFNMFGSYKHLVHMQQQLAVLFAELQAALQQDSSSSQQLLPCQLSLQASGVVEPHSQQQQQQQQPPEVLAAAAKLSAVLAAALEEAVQRFQLCSSNITTALVLKQQLHCCCAEVELLGQTLQATRALLLPHLPQLLPRLSQLQWHVTSMQLSCLTTALDSCCSTGANGLPGLDGFTASSSECGSGSPGNRQQHGAVQLLLTLCTDADSAADAVDAVHEGLGYCLLASLAEPQGQCWPSRADPAAVVAAAATAAAGASGGHSSPADAAAAQCLAELMQPAVDEHQQQQQQHGHQLDWPLLVQQLNLLHGCLPAVPLPQFWVVGSLNRASGSIAAAGAALAAAAAAGLRADSHSQEAQPSNEAAAAAPGSSHQQPADNGPDSRGAAPASADAAVARGTAADAVSDWMQSLALLEAQRPLLLRPLQEQHAHLLQSAAALVVAWASSSSSSSSSTTAPAAETSTACTEAVVQGVASVLEDVSAALAVAIRAAAAASAAEDSSSLCCADPQGAARAVAGAAMARLREAAEDSSSYHAAVLQDSSLVASIGGQLVVQLVQQQKERCQLAQQQPQQQQQPGVLQQLWQCVAVGVLDTSKVLDVLQQVTGSFHGSEDVRAQQLHNDLLQQLQASLLQLPQDVFEQLLVQQLEVRNGFAVSSSGVCRELWQQLLTAEGNKGAGVAVQLLQRLLEACLQLVFTSNLGETAKPSSTEGLDSGDNTGSSRGALTRGLNKRCLGAVSGLLGVLLQCATALGLSGVLAALHTVKGLAAACAAFAAGPAAETTTSGSGSSSGLPSDKSDSEQNNALTERLIAVLPLLLFVQKVISKVGSCHGAASAPTSRRRGRKGTHSAGMKVSGLVGSHSQGSDEEQHSSSGSSSAGLGPEASSQAPAPAGQQQQQEEAAGLSHAADSGGSGVPTGPFEAAVAAASGFVLQEDLVQVLGGSGAAGPFEDDEDFLDEFEDEEEYLSQLLQQGALAAGTSSSSQQAGTGAVAEPAQAAATTGTGAGDEQSEEGNEEEASLFDDDEDYHDAEDGLPAAGSSTLEPTTSASAGHGAATQPSAPAAAASDAGITAAAAAAFGPRAHPLNDGIDEDDQALLDEEFAALLQELLAAGAHADVALAAVTAATGMAPPAAAVTAAMEAAAASGDDGMVAAVEHLAAGVAAAAAAGEDPTRTAATSVATSPAAARHAAAPASSRQGQESAQQAAGVPASTGTRSRRSRRSSNGSNSSILPQLRRYWQRQRQHTAAAGAEDDSSRPQSLQCTFAQSGQQFVEQHWFQCYTCGLTDSRGCCLSCVRLCHAGHDVVYAARSRFFCDCGGENGPREHAVQCKCLSPVSINPAASASTAASSGSSSSSSASKLASQGWLMPAAEPLSCASLAASLPDPLDAAWAFDPELYAGVMPAAAGSGSDSSSSIASAGKGLSSQQQQQVPADAAQQLLHCGTSAWADEQQAAALKHVPQGLVAKAARLLRPSLANSTGDGAAEQMQHTDEQQTPQQVLQDVASSSLQLAQLTMRLLLQHSSMPRQAATATGSSPAAAASPTAAAMAEPSVPMQAVALPPVVHTKDLIMESSSSSSSSGKGFSNTAAGQGTKKTSSDSTGSSSSSHQQQPLLELQRVIRLGNMSSSSRNRSGMDYASDSSSSTSRGPDVPVEVTAALEGGLVCQQSAAAAKQGQLLAVCRGESVGLMDGRLLAAELCGRDVFSKEDITAAVAITSRALSPNPANSSSGGNESAGSSGGGGGGASSYFYVRRHAAKFHVLSLQWDELQGKRLLVVGYEQAQVWSVEGRDLTVADRLVLQLPAPEGGDEAGRVILGAAWLPGSDTWVAVTTPLRLFLFDLTHSSLRPAVVIEPEGHVLLSGRAAFVQRLLQGPGRAASTEQPGRVLLQQQLYALVLTREGQLMSAGLPQQLLDRQQACTAHWPHVSCQTGATVGATGSSSSSSSALAGDDPQGTSRSSSPGPQVGSNPATQQGRPSSRAGVGSRAAQGTQTGAVDSSCASGSCKLLAEPVVWPENAARLHTGRSCHWLPAQQLLLVTGTATAATAPAAAEGVSPADGQDQQQLQEEQQQLLLQLDATCSSVLHCCKWETSGAAVPVFGSPQPLVLSPAAVFWDLPLLPAARAHYGAAQLLAAAPGQAKQLQSATGSSSSSGQGCAYIAAVLPGTSSGSGSWQALVQPLHLRHSSAGAVVDGLAVLSFPYTQQLLLVVLCSKGNMYMYSSRRPPGLAPLQPFTQMLRLQLTQGTDCQQKGTAGSTAGGSSTPGGSSPPNAGQVPAGSEQHLLSKRAAATAVASGVYPTAATQASEGTPEQQVLPADASILLLQASQNMTGHLSVSGDISRAGGPEAAARALFKTPTDPERRLEAPSTGAGMTLVVKVASGCDLVPVGIKLLLPGSGAAPASVKVTCKDTASSSSSAPSSSTRPGSIAAIAAAARSAARAAAAGADSSAAARSARTVPLAAGGDSSGRGSEGRYQRWYQVILTPQESTAAAAAGQITLEFSPAVDPERRAAICHLDLFGQPADTVADRVKQQQQQDKEQVLPVDMSCTAAAAGVPATLMAARAQAGQASSTHPAAASSNQLLLDALLLAGAAAALVLRPAGADSDGSSNSSSLWQHEVLPVVQQLLCPDAHDAALWSPSWQCEATAHELLLTAVEPTATASPSAGATADRSSELAGHMHAALALKDKWRLQYAASVLEHFADASAALLPDRAGGTSMLLADAAVDAFLHAMGQLQSVLQARPQSVMQFLRQHIDSSGCILATGASHGLEAAVFSLKQLSSSPLLPSNLLAPLAKTAVELWLASAAVQQQQQQQGAFLEAPADVASGLLGLLLSPDQQLRLHAAAAWVQSCSSSTGSSTNSDADSSGCSGDDLTCAVFTGVAEMLLQERGCSCSQLLPAYQAVAEVASSFLQSAAAGQHQQQQPSLPAQSVARVVKVIVQQLQSLQQQPLNSVPACGGVVGPDSADRILLLQLLLTHILAVAWQQQQQQQGGKEEAASTSTPDSSSEQRQHQQVQRLSLCKQLLPQQLVQPLADSLLLTLQALGPLLQQQEQLGGASRRQVGPTCTVLAGEGLKPAGPGGYSNYQALLSPPPVVITWGVSSSCCSTLLGVTGNGSACSSSSSSAVVWPAGAWLIDPYLQGGQSGTRLLQGLPLQLTAASIDLAHVLLRYGLVQAIGKLTAAQLLRKQPQPQQQPQQQQQQAQGSQGVAAAGALCRVLCQMMDVADLQPLRPMAKQVVVDVAGSSSRYKEFRSLHLFSRHAAALLQALALPQEQQQLEPALGQPVVVASAAVAALQGSWQRQCAAAASLSQLLSVAESQPVCWAHLCSSRSDSSSGGGSLSWQGLPQVKLLLPLLLQMALHCTIPQLGLTALKLFNAALLGVFKGSTSSTRSSNGGAVGASPSKQSSGSGSTAGEQQGIGSTTAASSSSADRSKSNSVKGSAMKRIPLGLDWLLPEQPEEEQQDGSVSLGLLSDFIRCCALGWPEGRERKEAAKTLVLLHKALGAVGHSAAQSLLLQAVLRAVPAAGAAAGAGSLQLFSAASQLLKAAGEVAAQDSYLASADAKHSSLLQAISGTAEQLFRTAGSAAAALAGHPCAVAYPQLQQLMEVQPPGSSSSSSGCVRYWLEVSACDVALGRPHQKPSNFAVRLDSISAELKYGDKQVMARLAGWYSVHKLLLVVHSPRKSKSVSRLRLWYCDTPVNDLQQLKQQQPSSTPAGPAAAAAAMASSSSADGSLPAWRLAAADISLSPGQTEVAVEFELPLLLTCLMVEFTGFHVSVNELAAEVLHCPRCSHVVTDKHGLCGYCRENAYQCRQCRHINYEAPDAFICSECGHSRYGRFELLLQATKVPGCPAALAAAGSEDALAALDTIAAAAALKASALQQAAAAVQQQAAALATSDFHHMPEAAAAAAGSSSGGAAKRGSSGAGSSSSSSTELSLKPGLRHLAELYVQRCKPAYDDALQAARAHAAVRSAIAQAEPASSSSSSDDGGTGAGELSFSSCSYGHISAVLSAAVSLLRGVLAVAPSSMTLAATATQAVPTLLAMLQPTGSLPGASSRTTGPVHGSALAGDIRSLLLGLAKADGVLHEQLLLLLQQSLVPGLGLSHPAESQMGAPGKALTAGMEQQAVGLPSSNGHGPLRVLSGHELQLLLMLAQQEAHQAPKQAAAAAGPHAGAVRLVLLLLQQAVRDGCTHGLSPELLLLPGLKVMAGAAAAQQQLARSAAAEAKSAAMAAAAAGTPAPAVPGEEVAASADAALDLEVWLPAAAASDLEPSAAAAAPATAAAAGGGPNADDTHPADSVLDDAEAEQLEQLKIAEYLSRRGSGSHQPGLPRAAHSAPAYMQQQQQQQRLQQRQRLQPLGYGQSPFVGQQQQPAQNASSGDLQQTGGLRVASQPHHGSQQQLAAAAAAVNAPKTAAPTAAQAGAGPGSQEQQDPRAGGVVAAGSGLLALQELMLIAQELVLHPHSIAVRKEAAALLLQLQPEPLKRLQQLQRLVAGACRVTAQAAPGAPAAGTELFALLMETVAELLVQCSKHGSSTAGSTQPAAAHAQQEQRDSSAGANSLKSATAADASVAHAAVSVTAVHAALHGLLRVCCRELTLQIAGLLQQEQQLVTQRSAGPAASAAALPLLLEQIEQLLIGLAQVHQDHHHHHHHGHHGHHHQQQQEEEHQDQQQQRTDGHGWVEQPCLRQLLWSVGGLDALTAVRTTVTQSAAQQLHRLLRQGWLEGGDASGTTGGPGTAGDSDSAAEEDEDYTEADEYETEDEDEEEYTDYDEGDAGGDGDEHTEQHAAAAGGRGLLSGLPALSEAVLLQRRSQLVEALVQVLAGELQRFDQQQQQGLAVGLPSNPQAAGRSAARLTAAEASLVPAGLSWRSSLGVCSALVVLLSAAVSPEKPPPTYQLLLEKAATQEEFIPGQLPSGGLVGSAVLAAAAAAAGSGQDGGEGPLMRDVKNYICRRLDMSGLLDDDFGMELLVSGSIIALGLPVLDVIQHHWLPLYHQARSSRSSAAAAASGAGAAAGSTSAMPPPNVPMPVTFRLSGLDGEATEPLVKELNPASADGQNPEEENVLAGVLAHGNGTGLGLLLQLLLLAHQQPIRVLRRVSGQLLQLLKAAVGRAECRQQLLQQGALGSLLHLVHLACKPLLGASTSTSAQSSGVYVTAAKPFGVLGCGITGPQLLLLLECLQELVTEANRSGHAVQLGTTTASEGTGASLQPPQQQQQEQLLAPGSSSGGSGDGSMSLAAPRVSSSSTEVAQLADGLSVLESVGLGSCAAVLAQLLTALAHHSSTAQLGLITHFAPALNLQALDDAAAAESAAAATAAGARGVGEQAAAGAAVVAGDSDSGDEAGRDEGGDEAPLLSVVHSDTGGPLSAHELKLQLKGFLRLIEALSNSSSGSLDDVTRGSSLSVAVAAAAAADVPQPTAGSSSSSSVRVAAQQHAAADAVDFKQLVLQQGIPGRLSAYLLACFMASPAPEAVAAGSTDGATTAEVQLLQPGTPVWTAAAACPGVPFALQLLTALARGHAATAAAVAGESPSLLQLLHLLEGTAGGSTITPLAESCLEALAGSGAAGVADAIAALRAATAAEMRARAARKREALLASLGMVQIEAAAAAGGGIRIMPSPSGVPALSPLAAELAALEGSAEDDEANVCMVCREGYALQPATLLGCYCFCRVAAAAEWPGCAPPWGTPYDLLLTTVSHFNLIHVNCHAAAKAADASLRQPKREWQGATLRNGNVLCNSLLPLTAPAGGKAETAYAAAVTTFWQQQLSAPSSREAAAAAGSSGGGGGSDGGTAAVVSVSLSRRSSGLREADSSLLRVSLVAADLATLLWRFAAQLSFSEEARGGGRASNARLLFALLQLGCYYVVEAPKNDLRDAQQLLAAATGAAAAFGLEAAPAAGGGGGSSDAGKAAERKKGAAAAGAAGGAAQELADATSHAPFVLALSLLYMGPTEWMAVRRSMLALAARYGVSRALGQAAAAGASDGSGSSSSSHRRSSSGTSGAAASGAASVTAMSEADLYQAAAPMLRLFGYVDWLHQWAKPAVGLAAASSSTGSSGGGGGWGAAMAQQLLDLRGCSEAAAELCDLVAEAEDALGLQDLLDVLGLLGVVLGPKSSSCEEFVRQAAAGLEAR